MQQYYSKQELLNSAQLGTVSSGNQESSMIQSKNSLPRLLDNRSRPVGDHLNGSNREGVRTLLATDDSSRDTINVVTLHTTPTER